MNEHFKATVVQPIMSAIIKKAMDTPGVKEHPATMTSFILTELENFFKDFTLATTSPSQFIHNSDTELKEMIDKSTKPSESKPI